MKFHRNVLFHPSQDIFLRHICFHKVFVGKAERESMLTYYMLKIRSLVWDVREFKASLTVACYKNLCSASGRVGTEYLKYLSIALADNIQKVPPQDKHILIMMFKRFHASKCHTQGYIFNYCKLT